ncbi:MAG TPA: DUF2335 domain-containing protein [Pirellulales bacterium]|nr:DUF2335 domain-containing protein [Pirellulales bacterium]
MADDPRQNPYPESEPEGEIAGAESLKKQIRRRLTQDIIKKLPEELDNEQLAATIEELVSVEISSVFQGPLPPPWMLAEYEKACPGLSRKIIERADKEQDFRHEMIREQVSQDRWRRLMLGVPDTSHRLRRSLL